MKQKALVIFILILSLTLSACATGLQATQPMDDFASIPAVGLAQKALADQLGTTLEDAKIEKVEDETFSDSCLGLGGPEESCLQVETPGYIMQFTVRGQACEVRTNQDGTVIRTKCAEQ